MQEAVHRGRPWDRSISVSLKRGCVRLKGNRNSPRVQKPLPTREQILPLARLPSPPAAMYAFFPFVDLRKLTGDDLRRDLLASLAVTFMSVPQCIAYALIAGLPPAAGLYAAIFPTIIGSLFRSSRHVVAGPSNAVSLLVGGILAALSTQLDASPTELALGLAVMVGVMQVAAGSLRLGAVVDYISAPVVLGYITGAGVLIGIGQLHNLTGTVGGSGHVLAKVHTWAGGLSQLNTTALALGAVAAATMLGTRLINPKLPSALLGLVVSSGLSMALGLGESVQVVGDLAPVQAALPPLTLPTTIHGQMVVAAFAITVLSLVESSAVARSIADRTGDRLDLSVEFVGQGLSNITAAFSGGYPVSGSLSRSALNVDARASSRLAGVLSGVFLAGVLLVAGPLVDRIPIPTLAGLLVVIAYDLVKVPRIKQTLRAGTGDALAFVATLVGTWTLRLDHAIYLGVALSIILFLRRARMLRVQELALGKDGRLREVETVDGGGGPVRVLHVEGSLFFGAAGELRDALTTVGREPGVKALVVRLKRTRALDVTTAQVFSAVAKQLEDGGRHLVLVGMRPDAMGVLERTGVAEQVGRENLFPTRPGWFHAMDAGLSRALELTDAPADSPLRRYLEERAPMVHDSAVATPI